MAPNDTSLPRSRRPSGWIQRGLGDDSRAHTAHACSPSPQKHLTLGLYRERGLVAQWPRKLRHSARRCGRPGEELRQNPPGPCRRGWQSHLKPWTMDFTRFSQLLELFVVSFFVHEMVSIYVFCRCRRRWPDNSPGWPVAVWLSVCLSVCLSVHQTYYPSTIRASIHRTIYLTIYLSNQSTNLSINLSI